MLSLLAHGGAIALTATREHAVPPRAHAPTPPRRLAAAAIPPPTAPDEPMVVEVVELTAADADQASAHAHASSNEHAHEVAQASTSEHAHEVAHASSSERAHEVALSSTSERAEVAHGSRSPTDGAATTADAGATAPATGAGGAGLMHMRGGGAPAPGQGLSQDFIDWFLAQSRPVPPKDTEAERIDDDLASDRAALDDPRWVANASPAALLAMRQKLVDDLDRRDHQELHPAGGGWFKSVHTVHDMTGREREAFRADVAPDGTAALHDGGDGRYQPQELEWLDRTRDDRVAIGRRHEREVLAHTPQYVQRNVEWAWERGGDVATRKRDLFELWDECAETGDDAVVEAGASARLYVIAFIRSRLPAAGPDAYTAAELAALNAHRQSKQPFAPYDEGH